MTARCASRSPTDSEVTIRPSDPGWRRRSSPRTPQLLVIPPTPLEEGDAEGIRWREPEYPDDDEDGGWWGKLRDWMGVACFVPIKLCLYAKRSGGVSGRVV